MAYHKDTTPTARTTTENLEHFETLQTLAVINVSHILSKILEREGENPGNTENNSFYKHFLIFIGVS